MKNYLLIAMTILFISCTDRNDDFRNYNFKIENISGKDIVITSYDSQDNSVIKRTITISNNSFFSESFSSRLSDKVYLFEDVFKGDSVIISYNNNERKEIFTCIDKFNSAVGCDENRNILSYYNSTSTDNNINTTYTFDTNDYDNAND
jgi:hypothetical protein